MDHIDHLGQHDHEHEDDGTDESYPMVMMFHAGITVTTVEKFIVAVVVIFLIVIAIANEGLRFWREKLYGDYLCQQQISRIKLKNGALQSKTIRQLLTQKIHLKQTILHMIQVTVSYELMLIVMTYNVWHVLAIILGATVGYYFYFRWIRQRSVGVAENCCH